MKVQHIIIALIGLLSCNAGTSTNVQLVEAYEEVIDVPSVNIDSLDYVVLTYDTAKNWMFPKDVRPAELTKEEISRAEFLMLKQIEKYNQIRTEEFHQLDEKHPNHNIQLETFIIENPAKYARQYIPVTNSDGQKLVYINAFCSKQGHDYWKTDLVWVMDGGDCYFQVMINLTTNEVVDFSVNGVA